MKLLLYDDSLPCSCRDDAQVDLAKGMPMDGVQGVNQTRVIKWCEMQVCVCVFVWSN